MKLYIDFDNKKKSNVDSNVIWEEWSNFVRDPHHGPDPGSGKPRI